MEAQHHTLPSGVEAMPDQLLDGAALAGRGIVFLIAAEGAEQSEMLRPSDAVRMAGGEPRPVRSQDGEAQLFEHLDRGRTLPVDHTLAEADPADYDGLVLPGGVANPDRLRTDMTAVAFARALFAAGEPVATVCHAPWLLVETGVVKGGTLTSDRACAPISPTRAGALRGRGALSGSR